MRILVLTEVHRPLDARIFVRQITTLLEAGEHVTYVAPWTHTATRPPDHEGLTTRDVPRAVGRRRLRALRAVRHVVREVGPRHDLVLVHDPEILVGITGIPDLPPVVWDVHEDTAAALVDRSWVPGWLRPGVRALVRLVERQAERRCRLILAEATYASRFRAPHPVIRNLPRSVATQVVTPRADRVIYVGRLSTSRGLRTMLELAERLAPDGIAMELVGDPDQDVLADVQRAHDEGVVLWHGFVPNEQALQLMEGAGVGLSLLEDAPNFRSSLPSKVAEYLAHGVPVVTTPLPEAEALVSASGGGQIVPFDDVDAAEIAIRQILRDDGMRHTMATSGLAYARRELAWDDEGRRFVDLLRAWAT